MKIKPDHKTEILMLQPFETFLPLYIDRLLQLNKRYLVSQTYKRGATHPVEPQKDCILLSDYDAAGGANIHLNAVKHDKYAAILDLTKPAHKKKLLEMLDPNSGYQVFWAVVKSRKDLEARINAGYIPHMRRYIAKNTTWRIDHDATVFPQVQIAFGELFITLKWRSQTIRIKFEDIENS